MTNTIFGTPFADVLIGTHDGDTIWGYGGDDFLNGKQGDDFLYGGDGNDTIRGGSGDDNMYGGNGDDWMTGGSGNDLMYGGSGNDYVSGGGGNDYVFGGPGNDWLQGGGGDDRVIGGSGDDFLQGQAGDDSLSGGQGSDTLMGGTGADQFHWIAADFNNPKGSSDVIVDFNRLEGDNIHFTGVLPAQALLAALSNPGAEQTFSADSANVVGVTVSYGEDPQNAILMPNGNVTLHDNKSLLDTHIVFTYHNGGTSDIWVWDAQLQASDFVVDGNPLGLPN
jgi:Ca2+-binding RTX toxin-like protein